TAALQPTVLLAAPIDLAAIVAIQFAGSEGAALVTCRNHYSASLPHPSQFARNRLELLHADPPASVPLIPRSSITRRGLACESTACAVSLAGGHHDYLALAYRSKGHAARHAPTIR